MFINQNAVIFKRLIALFPHYITFIAKPFVIFFKLLDSVKELSTNFVFFRTFANPFLKGADVTKFKLCYGVFLLNHNCVLLIDLCRKLVISILQSIDGGVIAIVL